MVLINEKKYKVLYIARHAKSNWDYDNIADVDRPLKVKASRVPMKQHALLSLTAISLN